MADVCCRKRTTSLTAALLIERPSSRLVKSELKVLLCSSNPERSSLGSRCSTQQKWVRDTIEQFSLGPRVGRYDGNI
jgi:hypothetical protein